MPPVPYPNWKYYPPRARPPEWAFNVVAAFAESQDRIDSALRLGMNSNAALAELRPSLVALGFDVEAGKKRVEKIRRPVLFGDHGNEDLAYEVDAFHAEEGIALEVEAGRGVLGNAVYRDLIQTSLLIDARFLVLALLTEYHYKSGGKEMMSPNYRLARSILDAIYASTRLVLPLEGILLIGY
jgi:hypothetical protein